MTHRLSCCGRVGADGIRHDHVLVVHLLHADWAEVIYRMGRPARSVVPTDQWRAGQEVQDPRLLALPDSQLGDTYRLELALFDADSQEEIARFSAGEVMIP